MSAPRFADVALPLPVDHPFTYAIPHALGERAVVGMRAVVPILKRIDIGYVVKVKAATDVAKPL